MDFCQNFKFFYRFCNLFVFSFYRMGFLVKVSDFLEKLHQICWFSGCDLHLPEAPGLRKPLVILQGQQETSEIYVFWKKNWDFLKILCFFGFSLYRLAFLSKGSDFHEKKSPDLLVFWLWFSLPSEKIFRNLCILKKNLEVSSTFYTFFMFQSY